MPSQEQALQSTLLDFLVEPEAGKAFDADPTGFGTRRGLLPLHGAALLRFKDRLHIYRDGSRNGTQELLEQFLPITQALLEPAEAWDDCVSAFIASRTITTPSFRDILPAFIQWLANTSWGQAQWPSLLPLAHFECLAFLVARWPDEPRPHGLASQVTPGSKIVLDPATRIVQYPYGVHQATTEHPLPEALPVQLMAYRDRAGDVHAKEVTASTAALLVQAQEIPLDKAARALGLTDLDEVCTLMQELLAQEALWGFRRDRGSDSASPASGSALRGRASQVESCASDIPLGGWIVFRG